MRAAFRILRAAKTLVVTVLLVASMLLNVAMFTGGAIASAVSSAIYAATGVKSLVMRQSAEIADLASENRKLHSKLNDPPRRKVVFKGKKVTVDEAVDQTSEMISRRSKIAATRNVSSMAGEALPFVGAAVIVGATALELKDLCDTLQDMADLKRAFRSQVVDDDIADEVCGMATPSREELWERVKKSPGEAWASAQDQLPDLKNVTMPDWTRVPDWFSGTEEAMDDLLAYAASWWSSESILSGRVTHVRDGDTIEIDGRAVRLQGLHAPELSEPFGPLAKAAMEQIVDGQTLHCSLTGQRSYDRDIGICEDENGTDIARSLIMSGLGRDCPRHSKGRYASVETDAGRARFALPEYCVR